MDDKNWELMHYMAKGNLARQIKLKLGISPIYL